VVAAAPAEAAMKDNQCFTFQLTKEKTRGKERNEHIELHRYPKISAVKIYISWS
jgi:hypothetical protein